MKHGLFAELKRRHIYRVAVAYVVVSWLVIQAASTVVPALHLPDTLTTMIVVLVTLGFPIALTLAWAFEVTPDGVRRTKPAGSPNARSAEEHRKIARTLNHVIIGMLAVAVAVLAWQRWGSRTTAPNISKAAVGTATTVTHVTASTAVPGTAAPIPLAASSTTIPAKSIAVLPFFNDSGDRKQRYFSDGLSESLIIALSQYPALTVIGRESSFQLRHTKLDSVQIGKKLHVANLLEGSVSREGNEVRIRAELVSCANGRTLWSDQYDRPYRNLFSLQDGITKAVASALKAKLIGNTVGGAVVQTDRPPSGSLAAYNAYLEGTFYYNQYTGSSLRKAIADYEKAIAIDPDYVTAYAGLSFAWTYLSIGNLAGPAMTEGYAKARAAANKALKLDPHSAAAYEARGLLRLVMLDWRGAEVASRHALTLTPGSPVAKNQLSYDLASLGRLDEAMRLGREAIRTSPLNAAYYYAMAQFQSGANEQDAAAQTIQRAIALQPAASHYPALLSMIDDLRGHPRAALAEAQTEPNPSFHDWALALAYQAAGDKAHAQHELESLITKHATSAAYQIAEVYAYRNQPDRVFAWLDRAWTQSDPGITYLLFDPLLMKYRNDPRFAAFCRKVGLPVPKAKSSIPARRSTSGSASRS